MAQRIRRNVRAKESITDILEIFIADKESQGRAKKTIIDYEESVKKFIDYTGDKEITELVVGDIIKYRNHLLKGEELHNESINHYLRDLRTFVNYAYKYEYIEKKIPVELVKGQEPIKETFTDDELELLLRKPTNKNDFAEWRTYTIISYVLATGNRAETICSITMSDVDLDKRIVRISTAKNKRVSEIGIDKQITSILRKYIRDWRSDAVLSEYLFCNIEGNKLTTNALRQSFKKYCYERGVYKTSIHALRHTFAKLYILNGGSEFKLQQMLGHSTLAMTRHYVSMFGADIARDIDTVSPLVSLSKKSGGMERKIKRNNG